jgi:ornithine cyclodeaminase/alanine dehydrogenase-like protein (mu-crystallin family)
MTATDAVPFIDEARVRAALATGPLVDAMAEALEAYSTGRAEQPVRSLCALGGRDAVMLTKPAVFGVAAVKVVTLVPENAARGLPTHQALVLAFDRETGAPLAVLEGASITEIRTAAASAAAARALLTGPPQQIAVIGSGVQARSHIRVFRETFGPAPVRLWSPTRANAEAAAAETGAELAESAEAACAGADLVIAASSSAEPVVRDAWVAEGALVVSVGAPLKQWRELDDALIRRQLVADSRDAVLAGERRRGLDRRAGRRRDRRDPRRAGRRRPVAHARLQVWRSGGAGRRRGPAGPQRRGAALTPAR